MIRVETGRACEHCANLEYEFEIVYRWNYRECEFEKEYICFNCLDEFLNYNDAEYCTYHERYEYETRFSYVEDYGDICDEARLEGDFYSCDDCGGVYHCNNLIWDDDFCYCDDCYGNKNRIIKPYHKHNDEYKHTKLKCDDELNGIFYGIELEIASNVPPTTEKEELAEKLNRMNNYFVYENDGSIGYGFEIISYPFSKKFMDTKLERQLYHMLEKIKEHNFRGDRNCGLHFHVTRTSWDRTVDLVALVEYFKEEFFLLSKRDRSKLLRWANFYTEGLRKCELTRDKIKDSIQINKYHAVNVCKDNTIEFRFFNGTTDFDELMARYEIIYNLERYATKNTIKDLEDINFYDLITYESDKYVTNYLIRDFSEYMRRFKKEGLKKAEMTI